MTEANAHLLQYAIKTREGGWRYPFAEHDRFCIGRKPPVNIIVIMVTESQNQLEHPVHHVLSIV
jgi:hypothetical protein